MKITRIVARHVRMPFRHAFSTSRWTLTHKDAIVIEATTDAGLTGWGECVALAYPDYCYESTAINALVLLQLFGNLINLVLLPALPGPIIGMLLLFGLLLLRRSIPESLEKTAALLLQYLPLLLIVPAAGIMTSGAALLDDLPAIAAGLVLSLLITVPFCGWLMQRLIRRLDLKREDQA